jgi:hypothetical protein
MHIKIKFIPGASMYVYTCLYSRGGGDKLSVCVIWGFVFIFCFATYIKKCYCG